MEQKRHSLPGTATRKLLRAIREFDQIHPGDRVLVGFSGGKDSAFLLYALSILQHHQVIPFELGALSIDLGFERALDRTALEAFCHTLGVPFFIRKTEIAKYAFGEESKEGQCATCSFLRRGAINRFAGENGYNVVALAHHHDDAVETFLMSIIFSGQIKTFLPRTELDRTGITAIRPLAYFREEEIRSFLPNLGFKPVSNPCPLDGLTKRAEVKELIRDLTRHDKRVFYNLASAMRQGRTIELWPAEIGKIKSER